MILILYGCSYLNSYRKIITLHNITGYNFGIGELGRQSGISQSFFFNPAVLNEPVNIKKNAVVIMNNITCEIESFPAYVCGRFFVIHHNPYCRIHRQHYWLWWL